MLMNAKQAASRSGLSLSLIYRLCAEGRLPHYRVGGEGRRGKLLIAEADLEAFLQSCRVEGADDGPLRHIR
jgi:excisionase family DNA binding protein